VTGRYGVSSRDAAEDGLLTTAGQNNKTLQRGWIDGWDLDDGVEADLEGAENPSRMRSALAINMSIREAAYACMGGVSSVYARMKRWSRRSFQRQTHLPSQANGP
jgi:hypothetical protein